MDHLDGEGSGEARFAADVERLAGVLGHADRAAPLKTYCTGLILPGERKSIEPIAARVACRPTRHWLSLWMEPSCAGGSSETIRNSSRRSGWGITKAGAGEGSTITRRCALRLMDSWCLSEAGFPPRAQKRPSSRQFAFPTAIALGVLPVRPERHVETSITTVRIRLAAALTRLLPRCPCCYRQFVTQ